MAYVTFSKIVESDISTSNFEMAAPRILELLAENPDYDSATFKCGGLALTAYKGSSMEQLRADYQLASRNSLFGSIGRRY